MILEPFDMEDEPEMNMIVPFEDIEKEIYVDRLTVEYTGPFELHEIRLLIHNWSKQHGYAREERDTKEMVKEHSKDIHMQYRIQKSVSEKYFVFMNILIDFNDVTEMDVERNGKKRRIQNGKVKFLINGFLASWGEKDRWEAKGYIYFLRELVDKFVYKLDRGKYSGILIADAGDLSQKVKAQLNLTRFKVPKGQAEMTEELPPA